MPTSRIKLKVTQYVRINVGLNSLIVEALNGDIRIVITEKQPTPTNKAFHTLNDRQRLVLNSLDTNVWALASSSVVQAVVTESMPSSEYLINVSRGLVEGHSIIHKFGHSEIGTTVQPITSSGSFNTPSTAVALEFVSDNINDTLLGTGATKITITGLNEDWEEITQEIETNGTTAVAIPISLIRLSRWYVSESGSYADDTAASYAGNLTLRVSGAGATWDTIEGAGVFPGQSEIGVYTIPKGYTGFLLAKNVFTDTAKVANIFMLQRPNADDVTTPYTGTRRVLERDLGVSGGYNIPYQAPKGPFVGPFDIGFMGNVSVGTASVSVEFELLLIKDGH